MLVLGRKLNETIMIGEDIAISVVEIKGDQVKLGIRAPSSVKIYREEVFTAIQQENKRALSSGLPQSLPDLQAIKNQKKT